MIKKIAVIGLGIVVVFAFTFIGYTLSLVHKNSKAGVRAAIYLDTLIDLGMIPSVQEVQQRLIESQKVPQQ